MTCTTTTWLELFLDLLLAPIWGEQTFVHVSSEKVTKFKPFPPLAGCVTLHRHLCGAYDLGIQQHYTGWIHDEIPNWGQSQGIYW